MRLSPHKRAAMSALASHPHPLTQEPCSERLSYGMVKCDVTLCVDVAYACRPTTLRNFV